MVSLIEKMEEAENTKRSSVDDENIPGNDDTDNVLENEEAKVKKQKIIVLPDKKTIHLQTRNIESVVDLDLARMYTKCKEMERMIFCLDKNEFGTFKKAIDEIEWLARVVVNSNELVVSRKKRIGCFHTYPGIKNPYSKDFGQLKVDKDFLFSDEKYLSEIIVDFRNKVEYHHEKLHKSVGAVFEISHTQGSNQSLDSCPNRT